MTVTEAFFTEVGVTHAGLVALRFGTRSFEWNPDEAEKIGLALVEASNEARN